MHIEMVERRKEGKTEEMGGERGEKQVGSRGFCHCDGWIERIGALTREGVKIGWHLSLDLFSPFTRSPLVH